MVQAAPTFAQAMAKAVRQAAACWTQPQWRSPVMVPPLESPQLGRTQVVAVANFWAVGVGVAVGVAGECRVWLLPKERLPRGL